MEKPHVNEAFEQEQGSSVTPVDVSKLSQEEIAAGVKANLDAMTREFITKLTILEEIIGKKIKINLNGTLKDGRSVHIRVRESKIKIKKA